MSEFLSSKPDMVLECDLNKSIIDSIINTHSGEIVLVAFDSCYIRAIINFEIGYIFYFLAQVREDNINMVDVYKIDDEDGNSIRWAFYNEFSKHDVEKFSIVDSVKQYRAIRILIFDDEKWVPSVRKYFYRLEFPFNVPTMNLDTHEFFSLFLQINDLISSQAYQKVNFRVIEGKHYCLSCE